MVIYIIFLGSLTVFALVVLTPQSNTCMYTVCLAAVAKCLFVSFPNCIVEPNGCNANGLVSTQ